MGLDALRSRNGRAPHPYNVAPTTNPHSQLTIHYSPFTILPLPHWIMAGCNGLIIILIVIILRLFRFLRLIRLFWLLRFLRLIRLLGFVGLFWLWVG